MKKVFLGAVLCLSITATFVSCSDNNDDPTETPSATVDPNNFQGEINGDIILDASKVYYLKGKLVVKSGATLTIPAGTRIVASEGQVKDGVYSVPYLIVDRGGKLFVKGTASSPVVFEGAEHKRGYWGGIVILGKAPSNRSSTGESKSELGDLTYGGTDKTDSSGEISYLVIKDSGFRYNPEKEFNGLSLFGCGSGTKVSYVFVSEGADDGIESFGGNPSYDHLVLIDNADDQFDWTEGFSGTADYIYAKRTGKYANKFDDQGPGNRGIEADTQDTNPETTFGNGASNPTISNATFIGGGKNADSSVDTESQAFKLRAGTEGIFKNIVLAEWITGLDFETDRTFTWFTSGVKISDIRFVNVAKIWKAKATTANTNPDLSTVFSINANATGAGSGVDLPTWAKGWTGL